MKQFVVFFFLMLLPLQTMAQRRITVVDMDTSLPVKGVSVKVGGGQISVTDHAGHVNIPIVFESIVFSHIMYEPEHLTMTEVRDTMYLVPKEHQLPEVSITDRRMSTARRCAGRCRGTERHRFVRLCQYARPPSPSRQKTPRTR